LLIAAGGAQPLAMAAAAPKIPAGEPRIWFYQYGQHRGAALLIPTVVANGTYVGPAPPRTVFYRDVRPGHYDITIPDPRGFKFGSAHFDLAAGQQAFVKSCTGVCRSITTRCTGHQASPPGSSPNKLRKLSSRT
jgi:hypothetical protein